MRVGVLSKDNGRKVPDVHDATHMLAEPNRCVEDLGFAAVCVSPNPTGTRSSPRLHAGQPSALSVSATVGHR